MSQSHHTRPTIQIARSRFKRDQDGELIPPKIIERKPYPGDIHPISKVHISTFIRHLPIAYSYGLKSIELLPRKNPIGEPYGFYMNDEKRIILYSLPWPTWTFKSLPPHLEDWYDSHAAEIYRNDTNVEVRWKRHIDIAYFMFAEVFTHELGHHHQNRFKRKYKYPYNRNACEESADRHAKFLSESGAFRIWHDMTENTEQGAGANG